MLSGGLGTWCGWSLDCRLRGGDRWRQQRYRGIQAFLSYVSLSLIFSFDHSFFWVFPFLFQASTASSFHFALFLIKLTSCASPSTLPSLSLTSFSLFSSFSPLPLFPPSVPNHPSFHPPSAVLYLIPLLRAIHFASPGLFLHPPSS